MNSRVTIEDLQQLEHQGLDPNAIKEKDLDMDVEGQFKKLAINQLYNQIFKKFLCYHWVQSSIIRRYNLGSCKRNRFDPAVRNYNLLYAPTDYTKK